MDWDSDDDDDERMAMIQNDDVCHVTEGPNTSNSPSGEHGADIKETSDAEDAYSDDDEDNGLKRKIVYLYLVSGPMSGQVKFGYSCDAKASLTTR